MSAAAKDGADKVAFRQGFIACMRHFWLNRPDPNAVRQVAYRNPDWKRSFSDGWIAAADASEEHATHGVFLALERGILTKERQKKLIRWAAEWRDGGYASRGRRRKK